ncbi:hypothetical protein CDAR_504301 [Caerostris darwini]|uniref:Uncharacterized protein n=1 Tax=Caerostris darwini TaxID=1538125 RepID=A0AAV4RZ92_9ARAC|nr:hypothetical protein CDAR_504301 [Caerostris darwini]
MTTMLADSERMGTRTLWFRDTIYFIGMVSQTAQQALRHPCDPSQMFWTNARLVTLKKTLSDSYSPIFFHMAMQAFMRIMSSGLLTKIEMEPSHSNDRNLDRALRYLKSLHILHLCFETIRKSFRPSDYSPVTGRGHRVVM